MAELPGNRRLSRLEWVLFALFIGVMIYYAIITEIRSAFYDVRMTDFGVYLRAAWAARTGNDMYAVTCDNGWHYCYPPTFALFLMPLADPPGGDPREGYLPYGLSVGIWIVLSFAFVFWAVHALAQVALPDAKRGTRRWWSARNAPMAFCAAGIGHTIIHGQVNTLVAALLAGTILAWAKGRKLGSGIWLAGAAAVKVVPAFMMLFPILHRDRRVLAGVVLGGLLLFGVLPACVFGVPGAIRENLKLVDQVLVPGTTGQGDQTRAKELTRTDATDSQSFQAVIHNLRYTKMYERPVDASAATRIIHWVIIGLMTALTLWMGWRNRNSGVPEQLLVFGCLVLVMILASPVSHMHHYAMALPAISAFWLKGLADRPGYAWPRPWVLIPLFIWLAGTGIPHLPGFVFIQMRQFGSATFATVFLWASGLWTLASVRNQAAVPEGIAGRIEPGHAPGVADSSGTADAA